MLHYQVSQWVLCFFIYAFIGWIYEVLLVSSREKHFVNRGYLNGPILPIYGFGACAILLITLPIKDDLVAVFFGGMIGATILEYITGYVIDQLFHVRYWDYRKDFGNVNGYICVIASLVWGIASVLLMRFIHFPFIDSLLQYQSPFIKFIIYLGLTITLIDFYDSTKQLISYAKYMEVKMQIEKYIEILEIDTLDYMKEKKKMVEATKDEWLYNLQLMEYFLKEAHQINNRKLLLAIHHIKEKHLKNIKRLYKRLPNSMKK